MKHLNLKHLNSATDERGFNTDEVMELEINSVAPRSSTIAWSPNSVPNLRSIHVHSWPNQRSNRAASAAKFPEREL
jgi:hypothetical protein